MHESLIRRYEQFEAEQLTLGCLAVCDRVWDEPAL